MHGPALVTRAHRPRPIRLVERLRGRGWSLKVYGIAAQGERPSAELVNAGVARGVALLPALAPPDGPSGFG